MEFIFQENNNPYADDPKYAAEWQKQIDHMLAGMAMNSGRKDALADPQMRGMFRHMEFLSFLDHFEALRDDHNEYEIRDLDISEFYSPNHFLSQFKNGLSDEHFEKLTNYWIPKFQKRWDQRQQKIGEGYDYLDHPRRPKFGHNRKEGKGNPWWVIGPW